MNKVLGIYDVITHSKNVIGKNDGVVTLRVFKIPSDKNIDMYKQTFKPLFFNLVQHEIFEDIPKFTLCWYYYIMVDD